MHLVTYSWPSNQSTGWLNQKNSKELNRLSFKILNLLFESSTDGSCPGRPLEAIA
jgi:hypothetical protein